MSKAKHHFWHGLSWQILFLWTTQWRNGLLVSNDPLRKSNNHKRLTSPREAILHHPKAQRYWYKYICHDKCYWSLLCTHGSCTHVTHMIEAQSKQESARGWQWECSWSTNQGDGTYLRQISPCPWMRNSQTLGRSMSSSEKCSCIKKHKYPDLIFIIVSCC